MELKVTYLNKRITFSDFDEDDEIDIALQERFAGMSMYVNRENVKIIRDYLTMLLEQVK